MKYLKSYKIFEDDRFEDRDKTNQYHCEAGWVNYTSDNVIGAPENEYSEIKNEFNISSDELGFILLEFIDEYNLLYKCQKRGNKAILVSFYPNSNNINNLRDWMEPKIGHGQIWDWEMLSEMESRLNEHGLTIKEDGIYQIFLNVSSLKIVITKKSS